MRPKLYYINKVYKKSIKRWFTWNKKKRMKISNVNFKYSGVYNIIIYSEHCC